MKPTKGQDREFNRSEFAERQAELAEQNGVEFDATAPGLNLNSSFHVDSSVLDLQCEECDITYAVRSTDETGTGSADQGGAADTGRQWPRRLLRWSRPLQSRQLLCKLRQGN